MENLNNQGKRSDQYENSAKFAGYSIAGMIILLIVITLLGSCTTTKDTSIKKVDKCCKVDTKESKECE
tara:strand:+ start:411 stop:614 length:204 start_codon:yes stop_codon:yes gene_type:complete